MLLQIKPSGGGMSREDFFRQGQSIFKNIKRSNLHDPLLTQAVFKVFDVDDNNTIVCSEYLQAALKLNTF